MNSKCGNLQWGVCQVLNDRTEDIQHSVISVIQCEDEITIYGYGEEWNCLIVDWEVRTDVVVSS